MARASKPTATKPEAWVIVHFEMPSWALESDLGHCALVGVHGGELVPWPCPDAPEQAA